MHARARAQRALKRMQRRAATVATRLRVPHPRCELGIERGESISLGKATPRVWTPRGSSIAAGCASRQEVRHLGGNLQISASTTDPAPKSRRGRHHEGRRS
jgi:hypothetical protein